MARITLAEKKLKVKEVIIDPWSPNPAFLDLTAEGAPPVLIDLTKQGTLTISSARAITGSCQRILLNAQKRGVYAPGLTCNFQTTSIAIF